MQCEIEIKLPYTALYIDAQEQAKHAAKLNSIRQIQ